MPSSWAGIRSGIGALAAAVVVAAMAAGPQPGCSRDEPAKKAPAASEARPPKPVVHVAAQDDDLRVMVAELAAEKACSLIRGQFRGLRDPERPGVVTGSLWIRGCKITQRGTKVTFQLSAQGWQWAEKRQHKAGATFVVRQYVRFAVDASIPGALDTAYDRGTHVVSLWFTPSALPEVQFSPIGDVEVDEKGAWSSVLGAVSSVFASSPDEQAADQARDQGIHEFKKQFADGLSVTIDLCKGLPRFNLGRPPKGQMVAPDVGETHQVPAELHENGLLLFGPYPAPKGMTVQMRPRSGAVHTEILCQDQAEILAKSFAEGSVPPRVRTLAARDVRGDGTLRAKGQSCLVVVAARPIAPATAPVVFDWKRPVAEASVGPLVDCE